MMLQDVDVAPESLDDYAQIVGSEIIDRLRSLAKDLRGARVAHINSTLYGGGVSEILRSLVPLCRSLDIETDWLVIPGHPEFFEVTKGIHNGLQGGDFELTAEARDTYIRHSRVTARLVPDEYDFIVAHDPQPAALRSLRDGNHARWVWRCHIDTSEPNPEVLAFLKPFIFEHAVLVFTMDEFVPEALRDQRIVITPPGIDPANPKNLSIPENLSRRIIRWTGVRLDRPLITQISRFDPWKDPLGVIEVYRRIRHHIPGVQLALVGQMATDDPEGWGMYHEIIENTREDDDIHVLTNFTGVGNMEVNAFQRLSDVVLQKSIREGFGLVVSETLWKGTPMVAGRSGGIPMQMPEGIGGYLVDGLDQAAARTCELLTDREEARRLGEAGQRHVKANFMITRMLADELRLLASLA